MPTYEYRCTDCGHELEAVQSFSDPALTECPHCGKSTLRKLFGNVGVVFKGSGFYRNDSRSEGKSTSAAPKKDSVDSAAKSEKADKSGKADKAPTATTPKKDSGGGTSTGAAKPSGSSAGN